MTDTTEKLDLERIADIAPFPWTFIGNSWQYTTIYDANDETLFTLNLEEWGVTEDNQYDLEECQGALARFIIKAANALAYQNPTQDELTEQQDKAALISKVSEMKEALEATRDALKGADHYALGLTPIGNGVEATMPGLRAKVDLALSHSSELEVSAAPLGTDEGGTLWVNVHPEETSGCFFGRVFSNRQQADDNPLTGHNGTPRVACVPLAWLHGQGLNGAEAPTPVKSEGEGS